MSWVLKTLLSVKLIGWKYTWVKWPPFWGDPPTSSYGRGCGGCASQAFFNRTMPQTQRQHDKSNKITFPQHHTLTQLLDQTVQKYILWSEAFSMSKRDNWEKLTDDMNILSIVQGSFLPNPISVWSSPISKGEPRGKVEERCNSTVEIRTWWISEQFSLSKQKRWRSSTCNKSQISEQLHTLPPFQDERDAFNKGSSPRTRLFDKHRPKRCLFWHTFRQKLKKLYSFSMGRNLYKFLYLCFGLGPAPLIFTKILRIPIALLSRINIRIIIILEYMLAIAQTLIEIWQAKEHWFFCHKI